MPNEPLHDDAPLRNFERKYHDALMTPGAGTVQALGQALKDVLMDIYNRLARVERENEGR